MKFDKRRFRPTLEVLERRDMPASILVQMDASSVTIDRDGAVSTVARTGTVVVEGTADPDTINVQLAAGAAFNLFIDGKAGHDTIIVTAGAADTLIRARYQNTTITSGTTTGAFLGFEAQTFNGGDGHDVVWFYGSPIIDRFMHTRASDYMSDLVNTITAMGYERTEVRLSRNDLAVLYDSRWTDIFLESGNYARLMDFHKTYFVGVQGQGSLHLYGTNGGYNVMQRPSRMPYGFRRSGFYDLSSFLLSHGGGRSLKRLSYLLDPSLLKATSNHDLAVRLRNHVYQSYQLGSNSSAFLKVGPVTRYVRALVTGSETVLCQGAQILSSELLSAWGFRHRKVYLWASNKHDNHASVEVLLNGSWVIQDPTFGVEIRNVHGSLLGFRHLRSMTWFVERNGYPARTDREPIEEYHVPLDELSRYIFFSPGTPF